MIDIFSVTYATKDNPHMQHYQNAVRGKHTRIVKGKEEAKQFADTVEVIAIRDYTGKLIAL